MRVLLAVVIPFAVIAVEGWAHPREALAYDCGRVGCCANVAWIGAMDGADTRIYTGTMKMESTESADHINNALWVRDRQNSNGCIVEGDDVGTAWVEVGYQAQEYDQFFYWVDCRVNSEYHEQVLPDVTASDKYKYNLFRIKRIGYLSAYYQVHIAAPSLNMTTTLSYNPMSPDMIIIGGEATGTSGGYSPSSYFSDNRYIYVSPTGTQYHYQTAWIDDNNEDTGVYYYRDSEWMCGWQVRPGGSNPPGGKWHTRFPP
jgi:hypothetical protein